MTFEELPKFRNDLKRLLKKYRSLHSDLTVVRQILEIKPNDRPPFSFELNNLGIDTCVIKVKKIACKSLKGKGVNSGLRLIYAYFEHQNTIIFIVIYHKSDKDTESRQRILANFK